MLQITQSVLRPLALAMGLASTPLIALAADDTAAAPATAPTAAPATPADAPVTKPKHKAKAVHHQPAATTSNGTPSGPVTLEAPKPHVEAMQTMEAPQGTPRGPGGAASVKPAVVTPAPAHN